MDTYNGTLIKYQTERLTSTTEGTSYVEASSVKLNPFYKGRLELDNVIEVVPSSGISNSTLVSIMEQHAPEFTTTQDCAELIQVGDPLFISRRYISLPAYYDDMHYDYQFNPGINLESISAYNLVSESRKVILLEVEN